VNKIVQVVAAILIFGVCGSAAAQNQNCPHAPYEYRYYYMGNEQWVASAAGALAATDTIAKSRWDAGSTYASVTGSTSAVWTVTGSSCTVGSPEPYQTCGHDYFYIWTSTQTRYPTTGTYRSSFHMTRRDTVTCPPPPEPEVCDTEALGNTVSMVTDGESFPPRSVCHEESNCVATLVGGAACTIGLGSEGSCVFSATVGSQTCDPEATPPPPVIPTEDTGPSGCITWPGTEF